MVMVFIIFIMGCCQMAGKFESFDLNMHDDERKNSLQLKPCPGDKNDPEELTWASMNYSFQSDLQLPDQSNDMSLASWKFS
jgi:hypothetical protein